MITPRAYYNEFDPFAAEWLRELIKAGHVAPGEVDQRSIEDVTPNDLKGFVQCHFFAGVAIWSAALRGAGWPDDRPVWTGSCPCQPFSQAGKGAGIADERHLWPAWLHLIKHGKGAGVPVFGEQVASPDGLAWLDIVLADLEGEGYTPRAVDLCSAGFGSPNIRQRLYFHATRDGVAHGDTIYPGLERQHGNEPDRDQPGRIGEVQVGSVTTTGDVGGVASADSIGIRSEPGDGIGSESGVEAETRQWERSGADAGADGATSGLAGTGCDERGGRDTVRATDGQHDGQTSPREEGGPDRERPVNDATVRSTVSTEHPGAVNGFWRNVDWILCKPEPRFPNGAWRAVEPGTFPLAAGALNSVGRLRGYGNGLNKEVAQGFIRAVMAPKPPAHVSHS